MTLLKHAQSMCRAKIARCDGRRKNHTWNDAFVLRGIVVKLTALLLKWPEGMCDRVTGNSYTGMTSARVNVCLHV